MIRSLGPDADLLIDRHDDSVRSGSWSPVSTVTVRTAVSCVPWRYGTQKEVSSPPLNARTMAMGRETRIQTQKRRWLVRTSAFAEETAMPPSNVRAYSDHLTPGTPVRAVGRCSRRTRRARRRVVGSDGMGVVHHSNFSTRGASAIVKAPTPSSGENPVKGSASAIKKEKSRRVGTILGAKQRRRIETTIYGGTVAVAGARWFSLVCDDGRDRLAAFPPPSTPAGASRRDQKPGLRS